MIVRKSGGFVRLFTRNGTDYTPRLPAIAESARRLKSESFVLDGEAVIVGPAGLCDFDALRRRDGGLKAVLFAFDLLERDGLDFRGHPLEARKSLLAALLRGSSGHILLCDHVAAEGSVVFEHACRLGAEGIVSKRLGSPYRSGPCSTWIKIKNPAAIEAQRERGENWNS